MNKTGKRMSEIASILTVIGIVLVAFSIISGFIINDSTANFVRLVVFFIGSFFFLLALWVDITHI
jgi:flagellar motor component MotA